MTDLATMDQTTIEMLAGMTREEDAVQTLPQLPMLKINHDEESAHARGTWVVGQKKDKESNITREGSAVKAVVILTAKRRFNRYVQKDLSQNCNSPIFSDYREPIYGNTNNVECGRTCPHREAGIDDRCKSQHVVFGIAVTVDDQLEPCMMYQQGASWMIFSDYYDELIKFRHPVSGKTMTIPAFGHLTLLSSERRKTGAQTYFVSQFKKGPGFDAEKYTYFLGERDKADQYIKMVNDSQTKTKTKTKVGIPEVSPVVVPEVMKSANPTPPLPPPAPAESAMDAFEVTTPVSQESFGSVLPTTPITPAVEEKTETVEPTGSPAADIGDIERQISAALGV